METKKEVLLTTEHGTSKLVNAKILLELLWDERSRPSLRTLRTWTASRAIPAVRLGGLVFYDPQAVRAALARHQVKART